MSYEYLQQAPVLFGVGAIAELGERVKGFGCKKVLLVFDAGVKAAGISEKAIASLEASQVEYVAFDKVTADPPDYAVDEAGAFAQSQGIDCIVGIGGGSSMDTAKAISILMKHPAPIRQYLNLTGLPYAVDGGVPTILVPTSAGTGSEVTRMCIVTNTEVNVKVPIFTHGTLAIVDPDLCKTAPASVTSTGGLDALGHAIESITAAHGNPFCETLAVAAVKKIAKNLPTACVDGLNMEARSEMSLASNWAGIAFSATDVHIGHAAGDSIAAMYHTPHGLNVAWVSPAVQEAVAVAVPEKVKLVGEALGVEFDGTETPEQIGKKTGNAIRDLMRACGIPSLEAKGFDRESIIKEGAQYIVNSPLCYNCPMPVDIELATKVMTSVYDDYK